ncbi:hypothetical protein D3C78_1778930 [compost metagenome]
MEGGAGIRCGFGPDAAAVAGQHPAYAGQADTGARIVAGLVQALEYAEQLAGVGHVKACTIVADRELMTAIGLLLVVHADLRRLAVG